MWAWVYDILTTKAELNSVKMCEEPLCAGPVVEMVEEGREE